MTENPPDVSLAVFVGIDTHKDTHHAAIIDHLGRDIADREFAATAAGHRDLLAWLDGVGTIARIGVEGTGSYGSGVTATLQKAGFEVVDVDRTDRHSRRFHGKSDPLDAYSAARLAASGIARTVPKAHDGDVEAIRFLHNARRSAVKSRAEAITALKSAVVNAPETIREQLRDLTTAALVDACARLSRTKVKPGAVNAAVSAALRSIAHRIRAFDKEITALDKDLKVLVDATAGDLVERFGVGYETAAQLLITVGDNPERISTEAAFASLCGVAPIPASSGKNNRHRLNRGGNRQANRALHIIVLARLKRDPRTQAYRDRRLAEGKTPREIIRCLKRAVAREMFQLLTRKITT
ncbi:IS110 family transposase [Rhodococcoides kyotonense]|uniref:Transposase IS116/IS110/IS902 family protein n=1 Tax=Rhodococcoides kyotonense TaxID=398843 RepID=A0A239NFG2_9NOCA|nr:IS110 family transposase [Rhodococcus kyotonensis]SNT53666.1 Transposase IS116/IS110/IS902 family protein [Rhodococcus kyotonensis]